MNTIPAIGLEIHAELGTKTKMFCSCANVPLAEEPNVHICPVCMGHPGTLPLANSVAIASVIRVGLALGCKIASTSHFDRKNYFYPDLPKGYQISQYDAPLCVEGLLRVGERDIRIRRIHLEEDAGKLMHDGGGATFVDFNRAGVPLMEIVTEPDFHSGIEARLFAQELQTILRYLGVSDADMEKGLMRVEANISVRPEDIDTLGTKVEIKNLNSFRALERGIAYEIERQSALLDQGETIVQETRGWDEKSESTFSQRIKEEEQDYRYFPEPDIPPFQFSPQDIRNLKESLPELPQDKRKRFAKEYGIKGKEADIFIADRGLASYFENTASELASEHKGKEYAELLKLAQNYLASDLRGYLSESGRAISEIKMSAENFAELITLIARGEVSSAGAKSLLRAMAETGGDPSQMIAKQGLRQVSDETELAKAAREVLKQNPKAAEDYKNGKETALQFLVGKMMAATKGAANPEVAASILTTLLKNS